MEEFIKLEELISRNKSELTNISFSGVDVDLNSLQQYLEMAGRNTIDQQDYNSGALSFDKIKDYVKVKGKSLQIASSRALMSRIVKSPPK